MPGEHAAQDRNAWHGGESQYQQVMERAEVEYLQNAIGESFVASGPSQLEVLLKMANRVSLCADHSDHTLMLPWSATLQLRWFQPGLSRDPCRVPHIRGLLTELWRSCLDTILSSSMRVVLTS
jgi:hypothetical protein